MDLITGGLGFIGNELARQLRARGREVVLLDNRRRVAPRIKTKVGQHLDHRLFKQAHVAMNAQTHALQIKNGIHHQLTRSMPRDIATAVGLHALNTQIR